MDKLMKLIEKKKKEGKEMDPMQKEAKMSMLKALKDEMSGMMKEDLVNPAHKVEIGASSPEGLEQGLDKAKQLLHGHIDEMSNDDELGQDEDDEHNVSDNADHGVDEGMEESAEEGENMEHPEHEGEQHGGLTPQEYAQLQRLLAKKKMK